MIHWHMKTKSLRLVLVAMDSKLESQLAPAIKRNGQLRLVKTCPSLAEAFELVCDAFVVSAKIQTPSLEELISSVRARRPQSRLCFVATVEDRFRFDLPLARKADGFLCAEEPIDFDQELAEVVSGGERRSTRAEALLKQAEVEMQAIWAQLSDHDRKIAKLLRSGRDHKEIAFECGITRQAVEQRIQPLCKAFGAADKSDLIRSLAWGGVEVLRG